MEEPARILIKEKIATAGVELLRKDFEVDFVPDMSREEMLECIGEYEGLIVRSATKVDAEVIQAARQMKVIGRAGVGVDNIDVEAATKRGIMVINAPQSNIISAAEQTMALLMAMCRNVPEAVGSLRERCWDRKKFEGVELYHKVMGIVGLGRIGTLVAHRCLAFGMQVIAYDPYVSEEKGKKLGVELVSELEELLDQADFITVHLPKTPETYHLLGEEAFAKMKDGVRILNVARGGIIDEDALLAALDSGKVAAAALDVFEKEPATECPLIGHPGVIATPHLGASTQEAQDRAGTMIAEFVRLALKGEFVANVVNLPVPAEVDESVRLFMPLAEKLGLLLTYLVEGHVDEIEVEYLGGLAGNETGVLTVAVLKGFFQKVVFEPVNYINAPIFARERGIAVRETKSEQTRDYVNLIMVRGRRDGDDVAVGGTLVGLSNAERFVHVYEYDIDLSPSQYMAFFRYADIPGMIGKIGTILGNHDINIAHMQVGRRKISGEAVMGINVDTPISEDVMEEIRRVTDVKDSKFIILW
ncbi:MAG: phosphoglycerate dehydrogenase [Actinobacteria bacterium]|jgi:D-3-phosphoglycerate dehydrogenase|nr:MAG: phosphoglycerate dehydrogenase [Actinomycetota bacterium]